MKPIIQTELDYLFESLIALSMVVSGEGMEEIKAKQIAKMPGREAELAAVYDPLIELYAQVASQFDAKDERLALLFSDLPGTDESLWALLYYHHCMKQQGSANVFQIFSRLFADLFEETPHIEDERAFLSYVSGASLSLEAKSRLLVLYVEFEPLYEYLFSLAARAEGLLREKAHLADGMIDALARDLAALYEEGGLAEIFRALDIPLQLDDGRVYTIRPYLMQPSSIGVFGDDAILQFGVLVPLLSRLRLQDPFPQDRLLDYLKALSDKTKLEMLQILSKESLYGTQLAQRLSLSSATVSHHMSQLATLGLVNLVKEGNRFYYQTNPETFAAFWDEVRRRIL